jgi:ATP-dependent Zn protease
MDSQHAAWVPGGNGFLTPGGPGFMGNLLSTVLVLLLLVSAYTLITTNNEAKKQIPVSQVAQDVRAGTVSVIKISGNDLGLEYIDGTKKTSVKESSTSLSETLATYGVTPDQLAKVAISIEGETGLANRWTWPIQ